MIIKNYKKIPKDCPHVKIIVSIHYYIAISIFIFYAEGDGGAIG
jgi:hypothetical protein